MHTPAGSHAFPGDPSHAFALLQDPEPGAAKACLMGPLGSVLKAPQVVCRAALIDLKRVEWDANCLRAMVQSLAQATLEAEIREPIAAENGERTETRASAS